MATNQKTSISVSEAAASILKTLAATARHQRLRVLAIVLQEYADEALEEAAEPKEPLSGPAGVPASPPSPSRPRPSKKLRKQKRRVKPSPAEHRSAEESRLRSLAAAGSPPTDASLIESLPQKQKDVYEAIRNFVAAHGHSPSYPEISDLTDIPTGNVRVRVLDLERRGLLYREKDAQDRKIRLV